MGYELNRLMKQYGVATPTMAPAPQMPGAAPVQSAYTGATGSPGDAAKYAADKAAFDENVRKYGLAQKAYDQYKTEYENRLANTNMYNQAQFSTTGANVPAITTFSPAQRTAIGMAPATQPAAVKTSPADFMNSEAYRQFQKENEGSIGTMDMYESPYFGTVGSGSRGRAQDAAYENWRASQTPATAPGQQFAGLDQSGLNRLIRDYMAGNPSQQQIEADKKIYGVNDYDIRNAMGTGTQYGKPQWKDVLSYTPPSESVIPMPTTPVLQPDQTTPVLQPDQTTPLITENQDYSIYNGFNPEYNYSDYAEGMYSYARGGQVKGYQAGGLTDPETGVISYPVPGRLPLMSTPIGAPAPMQTVDAPATTGRLGELEMMLQRYGPQDRGYAEEIATARQRSQTEADAFAEMLNRMISSPEDEQASKAEMYFRLAAAFGSPTQTGQFTENLALAGREMADISSGKRESSAQKRALMLEAQKLKMGAAAEELETLRGLEAESMRDKRAIAQELLKDYIASGKPQSNAGRIAQDMGLSPGSPEYQAKVNQLSALDVERQMTALDLQMQNMDLRQANLELAQRRALELSPAEQQLRVTTEDILDSTRIAMEQLADAYSRNPNSLAGGWADRGQQFLLEAAGSDDPLLVNTNVINNLLSSQAVNRLKGTFGGNISDGERAALEKLQGINAVSKEERATIMRDAYKALQSIMRKNQTRLDQIVSGEYRMTQPLPAGGEQ